MGKSYHVAVVGVGAVGSEMLRVLHQRKFPMASLKVLARHAREIQVDGTKYAVEVTTPESFAAVDLALFAGGEGAKDHVGWKAVEQGTVVIDNGSAFRMYPNVPLVVPEVNPEALRKHEGFIANPNCSTIQMVVALGPLHQAARIKRVVVATYQAASGKGADAVEQLGREMAAKVQGGPPAPLAPFPHPLCGNVLPHIDSFLEDGYTKEEHKMVTETRKILGDDSIQITATTVRVPVENGHSEAVNVEFHSPLEAERARELLREAPGVVVQDDPGANVYPLPLAVSGTDEVYVGRIRQDRSVPYGLNLWVVADNLRKGAALNAVQIAEKMIEMGLL